MCGLLVLAGCKGSDKAAVQAPAQPAVVVAPPTPLDEKKAELGGTTWDPKWDEVVEKALPADLLGEQAARVVRAYCPNFARETKAQRGSSGLTCSTAHGVASFRRAAPLRYGNDRS